MRERNSLKHRTLKRIAAACLFLVTSYAPGRSFAYESAKESFRFTPSLDTHELAFTVSEGTYRVPRNYLVSLYLKGPNGEITGPNSGGFLIEATFPNFDGATSASIGCFKPVNVRECPDLIQILNRSNAISTRKRFEIIASDSHDRDEPTDYGLIRYRGPKMGGTGDVRETYITNDITDPIFIGCDAVSLFCRSYFDFGEAIHFEYSFDYRHLKDWRAIHEGAKRLIATFAQGSAE